MIRSSNSHSKNFSGLDYFSLFSDSVLLLVDGLKV